MTAPSVSVVIPSYNHGRFIARALQCLLDQTHSDWEAVVVDNHSQDNTDEVVGRLADPRIRVVKIHNDGVIAASRNRGIREARAEWVAFLDSDDWWTADKLERCLAFQSDADLIYHRLKVVRDDGRPPMRRVTPSCPLRTPAWRDLVLNGNPIANSSVIVRTRLLAEIVPFLSPGERSRLVARVAYLRGTHRYLRGDSARARAPLRTAFIGGSTELRLKAGSMLLRSLLPLSAAR